MQTITTRYDDMRIDRLLIKEYQKQLENDLKTIRGLNDIDLLLKGFESTFAKYIGSRHSFAVNSGTDALQLSLSVLGIKKGDTVMIPDITYPAVPLSIIYAGAEPIIVDVRKDDLQIDEKQLGKRIKKNTKAIIAVHMFARPCGIEAILDFARKKGLRVIEDCCQAESSEFKGRKLGSFGDISCFSFSYYKPLSSCGGGGGMVCFNDESLKKIADYTRIWDDHDVLLDAGRRFSRMNLLDLMAVRVKFKFLKDIIKSRLRIKEIYEKGLGDIRGIRIFKDAKDCLSVPQNFVVFSDKRDALGGYLQQKQVFWQRPYKLLHEMKIFSGFSQGPYPCSEEYAKSALQLPLYSFMKEDEALAVIDAIVSFNNR